MRPPAPTPDLRRELTVPSQGRALAAEGQAPSSPVLDLPAAPSPVQHCPIVRSHRAAATPRRRPNE